MKTSSKTYLFSFFLIILLFSGCTMDNNFVKPFPFPHGTLKANIFIGKPDSTRVFFDAITQAPTLVKNGDTLYKNINFESVYFKNSSGNELNGWILTSKTATHLPYFLVHFRGAGNGLMINQFQSILPLVERGYKILVFDYEGYGFSEGEATRRKLIGDCTAALTYLNTKIDRTKTKLLIYGQSFGGNLAIAVAEGTQEMIDGVVTEGAFSSHKDIAAHDSGLGGRIFVKELYSAEKAVKNLKKPILIIHSSEDEVVPFKHGQRILSCANEPKMFFEIKGKHLEGATKYGNEITEKIGAFFK
jgi:dipeptidyl aminopeptidase/acylaminoacyl peptidase